LLAAALRWVDRRGPGWLRLHLASGEEIETRIRDLISRESQCCSFFAFDLGPGDGDLLVDVRVPAGQTAVLDCLERGHCTPARVRGRDGSAVGPAVHARHAGRDWRRLARLA